MMVIPSTIIKNTFVAFLHYFSITPTLMVQIDAHSHRFTFTTVYWIHKYWSQILVYNMYSRHATLCHWTYHDNARWNYTPHVLPCISSFPFLLIPPYSNTMLILPEEQVQTVPLFQVCCFVGYIHVVYQCLFVGQYFYLILSRLYRCTMS